MQITLGIGSLNFLVNSIQHSTVKNEIKELDAKLRNLETILNSACTKVCTYPATYNKIQIRYLLILSLIYSYIRSHLYMVLREIMRPIKPLFQDYFKLMTPYVLSIDTEFQKRTNLKEHGKQANNIKYDCISFLRIKIVYLFDWKCRMK